MDPDEMPLPTLRRKKDTFSIIEDLKTSFKNSDPDQRIPKNNLGIVDSPLNDSLLMLADLSEDIQNDIVGESALFPCGICGRTFSKSSLERHSRVCEKMKSTPKRAVFNVEKVPGDLKDELAYISPLVTPVMPRKCSGDRRKGCDELQSCPHCTRKFGPKAFEDHVKWCEEKALRFGTPKKDHEALAKLSLRTTYKPKTPLLTRKESGRNQDQPSNDDRKESFESTKSEPTPNRRIKSRNCTNNKEKAYHTQSLNRSDSCRYYGDSRPKYNGAQISSSPLKRVASLGRHSDISYLNKKEHTVETENTHIIRQQTGRGSIRRPAATKSSLLRRKTSETGSQPLNEDQPNYESRRNASSGRINDSNNAYSTSDFCQSNSNYSSMRRKRSPTKIPAYSSNSTPIVPPYSTQQTPNTIRKIPQYVPDYTVTPKRIGAHPSSIRFPNQEETPKTGKKAPAMSSHQNYFHQLRTKLTKNFNKTFGGGSYTIAKSQQRVSRLPTINHNQISVGSSEQNNLLGNALNQNGGYLYKKLMEKTDSTVNNEIDYCPYELAAKQMKELMEESQRGKRKESFPHFPTKEFSDQEWQTYCNKAENYIDTHCQILEQNENQIDYQVESNSLIYDNGKILSPDNISLSNLHTKQRSSMRLMLTDFPDLNSKRKNSETDESDSFKDFLRLETEVLNGSPSPQSVRSDRKNSVESEKDGSDTQTEERSSPGYESRKVSLTKKQQALARFCYECGSQFPLPSIRFCCECGVQRLYM